MAAHGGEHSAAAWILLPQPCINQRCAVVPVTAAFVGGRAVAIGGAALASFWRLLLTSPATKTLMRSLIRAARPLLSGPFSVVSCSCILTAVVVLCCQPHTGPHQPRAHGNMHRIGQAPLLR